MNLTRISCLIVLLSLIGCGGGGEGVPVSGTVKVEGKALSTKNCFLRFESEGNIEGAKQISVNDDGTFEGRATAGPSKVYLYGIPAEGGGHGESGGASGVASAEKQFNPESVEVKSGEKFDLSFTPAPQ